MAKDVSFKIPEAYQVPEGTKDGMTFDETCTFVLSGDRLKLKSINGVSLDGKEEGEKAMPEEEQGEEGLAGRYAAAMMQSQGA